jgi:hypothetical protein
MFLTWRSIFEFATSDTRLTISLGKLGTAGSAVNDFVLAFHNGTNGMFIQLDYRQCLYCKVVRKTPTYSILTERIRHIFPITSDFDKHWAVLAKDSGHGSFELLLSLTGC